jgi:hypothetical protein
VTRAERARTSPARIAGQIAPRPAERGNFFG